MPASIATRTVARGTWRIASLILLMLLISSVVPAASAQEITERTIVFWTRGNHTLAAWDGGGGAVGAVRGQITGGYEHVFNIIDRNGGVLQSGDSVNIRTASGHFLSAHFGGGRVVHAFYPWAEQWETFDIYKVGNKGQLLPGVIENGTNIALRTATEHFVTAQDGGKGSVHAERTGVGRWEILTLVDAQPASVPSFTPEHLELRVVAAHARDETNPENGADNMQFEGIAYRLVDDVIAQDSAFVPRFGLGKFNDNTMRTYRNQLVHRFKVQARPNVYAAVLKLIEDDRGSDDYFNPETIEVEVPSPTFTWDGKFVSVPQVVEWRGHGGTYDIYFQWRLAP